MGIGCRGHGGGARGRGKGGGDFLIWKAKLLRVFGTVTALTTMECASLISQTATN